MRINKDLAPSTERGRRAAQRRMEHKREVLRRRERMADTADAVRLSCAIAVASDDRLAAGLRQLARLRGAPLKFRHGHGYEATVLGMAIGERCPRAFDRQQAAWRLRSAIHFPGVAARGLPLPIRLAGVSIAILAFFAAAIGASALLAHALCECGLLDAETAGAVGPLCFFAPALFLAKAANWSDMRGSLARAKDDASTLVIQVADLFPQTAHEAMGVARAAAEIRRRRSAGRLSWIPGSIRGIFGAAGDKARARPQKESGGRP